MAQLGRIDAFLHEPATPGHRAIDHGLGCGRPGRQGHTDRRGYRRRRPMATIAHGGCGGRGAATRSAEVSAVDSWLKVLAVKAAGCGPKAPLLRKGGPGG